MLVRKSVVCFFFLCYCNGWRELEQLSPTEPHLSFITLIRYQSVSIGSLCSYFIYCRIMLSATYKLCNLKFWLLNNMLLNFQFPSNPTLWSSYMLCILEYPPCSLNCVHSSCHIPPLCPLLPPLFYLLHFLRIFMSKQTWPPWLKGKVSQVLATVGIKAY